MQKPQADINLDMGSEEEEQVRADLIELAEQVKVKNKTVVQAHNEIRSIEEELTESDLHFVIGNFESIRISDYAKKLLSKMIDGK